MVGRTPTPEEQAAWNAGHIATRRAQAQVGKDVARKRVQRSAELRSQGDRAGAARMLQSAGRERTIAFQFGAQTNAIAAGHPTTLPEPGPQTPVNKARGRVQEPPEMTAVLGPKPPRGRRSWMPGKGLG